MKKRILSFALAFVMVLTLLPSFALAEGTDGQTEEQATVAEEVANTSESVGEDVTSTLETVGEETMGTGPEEVVQNELDVIEEAEVPEEAVAHVTYANGDDVGEGDDFGTEEEPYKVAGYYKTLQAAIAACPKASDNAAAKEAGAVIITMQKSVLIKSNSCLTIAKGQNVIVDLAGFDIAQECQTNKGSYVFEVSGILTIKDSTDEDADGEDCGSIYNSAGWTIDNDHPWGSSDYGFANNLINQQKGSAVTIESGKLMNNGNYCPYCIDVGCYAGSGTTTTNIKGGWLNSPQANSIRLINYNSNDANPQVLNISGGHIGSSTGVAALWTQCNNDGNGNTTINISGGLIQSKGYGANYSFIDTGNAKGLTYNISGGTIDCGTNGSAFYTYGGDVNITGGTFGGVFAINCLWDDQNIKISGGTFRGEVSVFGKYAKKGFITGGNFEKKVNYDDAETLYVKADGSIWFKTRYFSEQDLSSRKYKCLQDYVDDGYVIHAIHGLQVKDKNNPDAGYKDLEKFEICTADNMQTIDTVYIYETAEGWRTTAEERQRQFLRVWYEYEQQPGEYRFWDYWSYTRDYINWAIGQYGEGLTITQEDYDNTVFAEQYSYDFSYTNCKDLAILNDRMYRNEASWAITSDFLGTEQNPGPYAYKQIGGNLKAWEDAGYTLERHGQEGAYTQYYAYKSLGGRSLIAEGYVDKTNVDNPNTYDVVPVEVNLGKAEVDKDGKIKVKDKEVKVTYDEKDTPGEGDPSVVDAADAITETLRNNTVSGFLDTKIDDGTKKNDTSIKKNLKDEISSLDNNIREALEKAIDEAKLNSETDTKYEKRVDVDLKVADVVKTETADETTTLKVAVFDVQPNAKVTVTLKNTETGEITAIRTYETPISNEQIDDAISFRLPINQKESTYAVKVWHKAKEEGVPKAGNEDTYGEAQGLKFVQTAANGDKFIELSSNTFSYWTYAIVDVDSNAVVVIQDAEGNYRSFETLDVAIADWKSAGNEDDVSMILMKDVEGTDFRSKNIALDLNGCYLNGSATNATNLTISNADSSNQMRLAAEGVYKNDVSAFAADGYDTKTTTVLNDTVFSTTADDVYTVEATIEAEVDRDKAEGLDVFAGDEVTVTVKVNGARFVAADVSLTFDPALWEIVDSPTTMWDEDDGCFRFYNARNGGGYWPDGYVLGTFTFEAKAQSQNVTGDFKVSENDAYIAGAWSQGWNPESATKIDADHLKDAHARIILKNMTASVTPRSGLAYTATAQALLESGYTAKDSTTGAAITDATITYACLTKEEVEGTLKEGKTDEYVEGKEPKTPADTDYTGAIPAPVNAGDYVVFYKVAKDGYVTVSDKINVSIAKRQTAITWTESDFELGKSAGKKDNAGNDVAEYFYKTYVETAAAMPNAEYDSQETNTKANATADQLTVTKKPTTSDGSLKAVGSYEVTVDLGPNYYVTNPTCTLLIDGSLIEGYDLQNTTEGATVWYDGYDHTVAQLVKDTTLVPPEENVTIKYSLNDGEWQDSIPDVKEVGKYKLDMKITADSYYDFTDTVNFEIKNVEYKVEKTDYVTGWDLVLVYTNDAVPGFKYDMNDGTSLVNTYNVSDLGYKFGTIWNAAGTAIVTEGTGYTYVYGLVVFGDADITKIVPSNEAAITINRTNTKNRYDVNNSNTVDINDLVAVQGTYNVSTAYLNDEQMSIVLRADVSGNKKVDTYDCSLVKLNSGAN